MKHILLFLFAFGIFNLNAQQEQDSCLIAKYYFNSGTITDDYINGYNGKSCVGATLVADRFGNPGAAWYLNGTQNSYINLGTHAALKPTTLSVSMWIKITAPSFSGSGYSYNPILLTKTQTGPNCWESYCFYYDMNTNKIATACTKLPCTQPSIWTPNVVTSGTWHHLVFTWDNTTIKLYLDAVLQGTVSKGFSQVYLSTDSVMVGNSANTANNRFFNGTVDDMRFYNCVIDQTKVTSLYNEPNWFVPTDVKSIKKDEKINIYPNPFNDKISISYYIPLDFPFQIYNTLGSVIYSGKMEKGKSEIDLSNQPSGIYFIKAGTITKKIIKQ